MKPKCAPRTAFFYNVRYIGIYTAQELDDVRNALSGNYILMQSIDLEGMSWVPIGQGVGSFSGIFDGQNYSILNLSSSQGGLFANIRGVVKNTHISEASIAVLGEVQGVGGIVNSNDGGTIQYCSFSGSISGYRYCGGIVGMNMGTVAFCKNTGSINSNVEMAGLGGIAGYSSRNIDQCFNEGNIGGSARVTVVGGICGDLGAPGRITNSYNTGSIRAYGTAGGILGMMLSSQITVQNCYSNGSVSASFYGGGIVSTYPGNANTSGISNCYVGTDAILNLDKLGDAFTSDVNHKNNGYPVLVWTVTSDEKPVYGTTNWDFIIPVTHQIVVPNGYTGIHTPEDLDDIRNDLSGAYILMNDIDLSDWGNWTPIGNVPLYSSSEPFEGVFDGNGFSISNMKIVTSKILDENMVSAYGLFAELENSTIKNLGITNATIGFNTIDSTLNFVVGGVAARAYESIINNCFFDGSISMIKRKNPEILLRWDNLYCTIGGIVGNVGGNVSSVLNCYNTATILADNQSSSPQLYVGGIIGELTSGRKSVKGCINYGDISATSINFETGSGGGTRMGSCIGGIIGHYWPSLSTLSTVEECANHGDIIVDYTEKGGSFWCDSAVGGIVGESGDSASLIVKNSYNVGDISATLNTSSTMYLGGIAGGRNVSIYESYNAGVLTSFSSNVSLGELAGACRNSINNSYYSNDVSVTMWPRAASAML